MSLKISTPGFVRGNVFWVTPPEGTNETEKWKTRPAVIISSDAGNSTSPNLTVLLLSTSETRKKLSVNVPIHSIADSGESVVLCASCVTYSKSRFGDYVGRLTDAEMARVERAFCEANGISHWGGTIEKLQEDKDRQALAFAEHKQKLEAQMLEKDKEIQRLKEQLQVWELQDQRKAGQIAVLTEKLFEADVKELLYEKAVAEVARLKTEKPVVVVPEPVIEEPKADQPSSLININTCESNVLRQLGMSQGAASQIVSHRKKYGPYEHIEDLLNLPLFGKRMMVSYGGYLTV